MSEQRRRELTEKIKTRLFEENPQARDYNPELLAVLVRAGLRSELRAELPCLPDRGESLF